jgi:hypothetical protein
MELADTEDALKFDDTKTLSSVPCAAEQVSDPSLARRSNSGHEAPNADQLTETPPESRDHMQG